MASFTKYRTLVESVRTVRGSPVSEWSRHLGSALPTSPKIIQNVAEKIASIVIISAIQSTLAQ